MTHALLTVAAAIVVMAVAAVVALAGARLGEWICDRDEARARQTRPRRGGGKP